MSEKIVFSIISILLAWNFHVYKILDTGFIIFVTNYALKTFTL